MKIPGWLRSRRFRLIEGDGQRSGYTELLAVHEFEKVNGLDGKEHEFAKSRPWRNRVLGLVESRKNQRYAFIHEVDANDYRKPAEFTTGMTNSHLTNGVHKVSNSISGPWSLRSDGKASPTFFSNSLAELYSRDATVGELASSSCGFDSCAVIPRPQSRCQGYCTINLPTDHPARSLSQRLPAPYQYWCPLHRRLSRRHLDCEVHKQISFSTLMLHAPSTKTLKIRPGTHTAHNYGHWIFGDSREGKWLCAVTLRLVDYKNLHWCRRTFHNLWIPKS